MELWLGEGFALLGFLRPTSAPLGATTIPSGIRVPTSLPPVCGPPVSKVLRIGVSTAPLGPRVVFSCTVPAGTASKPASLLRPGATWRGVGPPPPPKTRARISRLVRVRVGVRARVRVKG